MKSLDKMKRLPIEMKRYLFLPETAAKGQIWTSMEAVFHTH